MTQRTQIIPIAERFEPSMRDAIIRVFNRLRTQYTVEELTRFLESGGLPEIMSTIDNMEDVISIEFLDDFENAANVGGALAVEFIPAQAVFNKDFRYSPIDPASASFIRDYEYNLVNQISNVTRESLREALTVGYQQGLNPREQARLFRNTLGLTPKQQRWVDNYRRQLTELDSGALERVLRDGRFDSTVLNAIKNNQPLSQQQIDRMVQRYRERLVLHRSEMIARTESLRAISIGQEQGVQQLIRNRAIDTGNIRQFWIVSRDERTRITHRPIPTMNKEGIPLGDVFKTPLGPLRFPRDPNGTAANTINCRCRRVFRMIED